MDAGAKGSDLCCNGVTKRFGSTLALDDVDIRCSLGRVHALLGHNGSGKSTLVRVLRGTLRPDEGSVSVDGMVHSGSRAIEAGSRRVSAVHQDLGLFAEMGALENFRILTGLGNRWRNHWAEVGERARAASSLLGVAIPWDVPAGQLSPANQTMLAMAAAISKLQRGDEADPRYLILDEVTVSLGRSEFRRVASVIKSVREQGVGVVFVSHRLSEVCELADEVTVLRNGKVVAEGPIARYSEESLAKLVAGEASGAEDPRPMIGKGGARGNVANQPPVAMTVSQMNTVDLVDVSLEVRKGRILGIAGLAGSGRESISAALVGNCGLWSGRMETQRGATARMRPAMARKMGISVSPGSRSRSGIIGEMSVRENISLLSMGQVRGRGWRIRGRQEMAIAESWIDTFSVQPSRPEQRAEWLSGGNRQKVLLARCLQTKPDVLIVEEPSAGVDVGILQEFNRVLRQLANGGTALIVVSSVLEELVNLCDEVVVLAEGRRVALLRGELLTEERIYYEMAKGERSTPSQTFVRSEP